MSDQLPAWVGREPGQIEQLCVVSCNDCSTRSTLRSKQGEVLIEDGHAWAIADGWLLARDARWRCPACAVNQVQPRIAAPSRRPPPRTTGQQ